MACVSLCVCLCMLLQNEISRAVFIWNESDPLIVSVMPSLSLFHPVLHDSLYVAFILLKCVIYCVFTQIYFFVLFSIVYLYKKSIEKKDRNKLRPCVFVEKVLWVLAVATAAQLYDR